MKRWIIIAVIALMVGWTVYDFVLKDKSTEADQEAQVDTEQVETDDNNDDSNSNDQEVSKSENAEVGLQKGNLAPDFELTTLEGETAKLSDYRGQRVMLNFWATWCPPCRAEIPDMQKFYENEEVAILAVNAFETERSMDVVEEFVDEFGMTFDVLIDEESKATTIYNVFSFPTTFMIDSEGIIQNMAPGALNYEQMIQAHAEMD